MPSCLIQTRYSLASPRAEAGILWPPRVSKSGAHCGSLGFAPAFILTCRLIGVSDTFSKVTSLVVPSSCFSVAANTQSRRSLVLKYFVLIHRVPLLGCRL